METCIRCAAASVRGVLRVLVLTRAGVSVTGAMLLGGCDLASLPDAAGLDGSPDAAGEDARVASDASFDGGGDGSGPACDAWKPWLGSHNLFFADVAGHSEHELPVASLALQVRLDIRCVGQQVDAVAHPAIALPGATPSALTVEMSPDAIVLAGSIAVPGPEDGDLFAHDDWTSLTLPVDAEGKPTGTFHADGECEWWTGSGFSTTPISAEGGVFADVARPIIIQDLVRRDNGPQGVLLPWDDIVVYLSEPLERDSVESSLVVVQVDEPSNNSPFLPWEVLSPTDPSLADWPGITQLRTRISPWTSDTYSGHRLLFRSPVTDPSGNEAHVASKDLKMGGAVGASTAWEFSPSGFPTGWGEANVYEAGTDPSSPCGPRDCMVLTARESFVGGDGGGPFRKHAGVAPVLATAGATSVHAVLRFLDAVTPPVLEDYYHDQRFFIDLVYPDGSRTTHPIDSAVSMQAMVPPAGEFLRGSEWRELSFPIESPADVVAAVIWTGCNGSDWSIYELPARAIAIDRVFAQ